MKSQRGFGFIQIVLVVVLLAVGFGGWSFYQKQLSKKEAATVAAQIRDATDRTRQQIGFFKTPRGETYAEAIAAADAHVKALDAAVAALNQIHEPRNPVVVRHGIEYIQAAQNAIRSLRNMVRAKAELTVAANSAKSALSDLETYVANPGDDTNKFHSDVARYSAGPIQKRLAAANESLDQAVRSSGVSLSSLMAVSEKRPSAIPADNYLTATDVSDITFKVL